MSKEFANVQYFGSDKIYKYEVPEELKGKVNQGDFVLVKVPDGNTIAKVYRISKTEPIFKCKPILKVIELN